MCEKENFQHDLDGDSFLLAACADEQCPPVEEPTRKKQKTDSIFAGILHIVEVDVHQQSTPTTTAKKVNKLSLCKQSRSGKTSIMDNLQQTKEVSSLIISCNLQNQVVKRNFAEQQNLDSIQIVQDIRPICKSRKESRESSKRKASSTMVKQTKIKTWLKSRDAAVLSKRLPPQVESASIIEISDDEEFAEAVPIDKSAQAKEGHESSAVSKVITAKQSSTGKRAKKPSRWLKYCQNAPAVSKRVPQAVEKSASIIVISDDEPMDEAVPIDRAAKAKEGQESCMSKEVTLPTSTNVGRSSNKPWQKFPGPAGVIRKDTSEQTLSQAIGETTKLQFIDKNKLWRLMLCNEECAKTPSLFDTYNIAWAKRKLAQTNAFFKIPILACVVQNVEYGYIHTRVELVDPSGMTTGIIQREIMDRHGSIFSTPGTVFIVQNVTVVKMSKGTMSLIISINNLVSMYYTKKELDNTMQFRKVCKQEVLRNLDKLKRQEMEGREMLGEEIGSQDYSTQIVIGEDNSSNNDKTLLDSMFAPGSTSTQMPLLPLPPSAASQFSPGFTSTQMSVQMVVHERETTAPRNLPQNVQTHGDSSTAQSNDNEHIATLFEGLDDDAIFGEF